MAATEALLTWGGLPSLEEEEESRMEGLRERLQAMALAVQAKDAALHDLQRRLQAALGDVEQARAQEATLRRRTEVAEAAEEAMASQMAELEAEAYASITQCSKIQKKAVQRSEDALMSKWEEPMAARQRIEELERRLEAAMEEAGGWKRRYREAKAEVALSRRVAAEAEASARKVEESMKASRIESEGPVTDGHAADLQRDVERTLEAVHAKLQEQAEGKGKQTRKGRDEAVVSMSLQELAGMAKMRLWSPSSLTVCST
ncbi:hypothetical protein L7F22_031065 [Adiantum nelumboides]|nr:hypothetical protein [Adiantum nelumboides]